MPENIYIHELNLGLLEAKVLRKLWQQFDEETDGTAPDTAFSKYSRTRIRSAINESYSYMAVLGRMIQSWFIIPTKTGYGQYPVPLNVADVDKVFYYTAAAAYEELRVYDRSVLDELEPGWRTNTGIPEYAYSGDWSRTGRKLGITPIPTVDATAVTLAVTVLSRPTPYGAVEAVSGSANPDSALLTYVDSHSQNFSKLGVVPGMTILNITDDSRGVITSLATTNTTDDTLVCSAGLSGGSVNIWTPGDEMRIIGGDYGGIIEIGDTEAEYLLAPNAGQLPSPGITMAAGNLLVEAFLVPVLLADKYQYPEIHPMFHPGIVLGAAASLAEEEPVDSPEFAKAQGYRSQFDRYVKAASGFMASHYKSGDGQQLWGRRS